MDDDGLGDPGGDVCSWYRLSVAGMLRSTEPLLQLEAVAKGDACTEGAGEGLLEWVCATGGLFRDAVNSGVDDDVLEDEVVATDGGGVADKACLSGLSTWCNCRNDKVCLALEPIPALASEEQGSKLGEWAAPMPPPCADGGRGHDLIRRSHDALVVLGRNGCGVGSKWFKRGSRSSLLDGGQVAQRQQLKEVLIYAIGGPGCHAVRPVVRQSVKHKWLKGRALYSLDGRYCPVNVNFHSRSRRGR